ncbi:MAG: oligosaccharide flippase family protein [Candidatus Omnitrophica bacterium]|nr:oligosaccharide flippase family protein [Candidatus Omnitrophota bacterium]
MKSLRSERFRRLSKEGFWVIFGQALAVLGSLVGVRVLTGLLDPKAYGELALGLTVAMLVNQVVLGPLGNGITRFYAPAAEKGDLYGYLNSARRLMLSATGVVFFMSMFTIFSLLIIRRVEWIGITVTAFIFAVFSGYNASLSGVQNAARQRAIVALHQGVEPWARFLVVAALIVFFGATSTVAMFGYAIAVVLVLGSQYVFFQKKISVRQEKSCCKTNWAKQIWNFSWPISAFGCFTWLQLGSDRWALQLFTKTAEVGRYAALFQLGYYPMSLASGMASQFLAPIFYQRTGDGSDNLRNAHVNELSWRLVIFILGITGAVFLAAVFFHGPIFRIFVAKQYGSVSFLLPWMLVAGGIFAAGQTIALELQSRMKTRVMMVAKITTALLGVVFNFAGAFFFDIPGVVFAGVLFSLLYFFWMAVIQRERKGMGDVFIEKAAFNNEAGC